eukprot:352249-Chlamydomonas_euryale.AAC.25
MHALQTIQHWQLGRPSSPLPKLSNIEVIIASWSRLMVLDTRSLQLCWHASLGLECMHGDALGQAGSTAYRKMVGSLIHVAVNTRPDIQFAASTLSKHMGEPRSQQMAAAKHLLRAMAPLAMLILIGLPTRQIGNPERDLCPPLMEELLPGAA